MRTKEVKKQRKINDSNQKDNTKNNDNNDYNDKNKLNQNNGNDKEKIKQNNNDNLIKKKDKENNENKENNEKEFNQKDYKSPFPVPGYESWENLWEFVCELIDQNIPTTQNNYAAGIRGLLEIQKKRQTSSAQNNINLNKRNKNNIIDNLNTYKEKIINKNTKEINKNNSINAAENK